MSAAQGVVVWALVGLVVGASLVPATRRVMNNRPSMRALLPIAAAITGALFALVIWQLPGWPEVLGYSAFAALAVPLAVVDLTEQRLPTPLVRSSYAAVVTAIAISALMNGETSSAIRAAAGMIGLLTVYLAIGLAFPRELGAGDVRLAGVIGAVLSWHSWTTFVAGAALIAVSGCVVGLAVLVVRRAPRQTQIPAGPTMLLGALLALMLA
jgi:leader peptidase (prepilin peptidase)/N-methyltransferase